LGRLAAHLPKSMSEMSNQTCFWPERTEREKCVNSFFARSPIIWRFPDEINSSVADAFRRLFIYLFERVMRAASFENFQSMLEFLRTREKHSQAA